MYLPLIVFLSPIIKWKVKYNFLKIRKKREGDIFEDTISLFFVFIISLVKPLINFVNCDNYKKRYLFQCQSVFKDNSKIQVAADFRLNL